MREDRKRRLATAGSLLLFVLLLAGGTVLFWDSLTAMVADPEAFRNEMEAYGWVGRLIFTALMATQVVLAPIPGHPFEVVAGYSFGVLWGVMLCSLGALLGSLIAFALSRALGAKAVKTFYNAEKLQKVFFLKTSERRNAFAFIFFLIPGVPKDMLAYFMGLTDMHPCMFILISTLGRLPGILVAVLGGAAAGERSLPLVIGFLAALLLITALTLWLYRRKLPRDRAQAPFSEHE
ncbi:MAG: TVP38/TMEM64 family protein [Clostridia bacterium]|nr:TVP38/TMEM64 family protein [Clostridia bacterium]